MISDESLDVIPRSVVDMADGSGLVQYYKILIAMEKLGAWPHPGLQVSFNTESELKLARESLSVYYTLPEKE